MAGQLPFYAPTPHLPELVQSRTKGNIIIMIRKLKRGWWAAEETALSGVHRMAARLDGEIELVAGAFSSDPEKSRSSGEDLSLESERVYPDYQTMVEAETKLPIEKRIDFASIVTPTHHFPVAKLFLEAGFNVVCYKPMTFDLAEALELRDLVKKSGKILP
jgi:predicted dehydrogenase